MGEAVEPLNRFRSRRRELSSSTSANVRARDAEQPTFSPLCVCMFRRTRSSSFSILRPMIPCAAYTPNASPPIRPVRRKNAIQPARKAVKIQTATRAASIARAYWLSDEVMLDRLSLGTGGGNCWRRMLEG